MPRSPIALILSVAMHVVFGAFVAVVAGWTPAARPHVIQVNGTPQPRGAGRDLLGDILRANGVPIRLTDHTNGDAVGLAWWSPSVGLWLAVDRMPPHQSQQRLRVTLQVGNDTTAIGPIHIDDEGSGRILTAWANVLPAPGTSITLTVSERGSWWRAAKQAVALEGKTEMRKFELRSQK